MRIPTASHVAAFFDAVNNGAHDRVQAMLQADPTLVRAFDVRCFGATPLVRAAGLNDRKMIELLINAGADPNQRNDWWAGGFGVLDGCTSETAEYLLKRGAMLTPHAAARLGKYDELQEMLRRDQQVVRQRGGDGQFPLHFASSPQIAALLLAHGAELDALDVDHESTAAQWAGPERPEVAAFLVQRGAQPDPFLATMIGDLPLLQRLLAQEPDGIHARITRTSFPTTEKAAGHIYLFTIGENATLAHAAAAANRAEIIRWLAGAGADVNARGGYDDATPLHTAAWSNRAETIEALIQCGAEIDAPSGPMHQNQPLGWAIVGGSVAAVRALLAGGCAVLDHHRADARAGAAGQFRCFKPAIPLDDWHKIEQFVTGHECGPA